jgi:hypothetical protein
LEVEDLPQVYMISQRVPLSDRRDFTVDVVKIILPESKELWLNPRIAEISIRLGCSEK